MRPFLFGRMALFLLALGALTGLASAADQGGTDTWSTPVDGLSCRLVVRPDYVVGQALSVVVEIKNVSDQKRYLVPLLNPHLPEITAIDIVGPKGQKLKQTAYGSGIGLGVNSFQAIGPGEVKRFEATDVRDHFDSLQNHKCYPERRPVQPEPGKYTLTLRYRSPKVPARFTTGSTIKAGKQETNYQDPTAELVKGQWANEVTSKPVTFELRTLKPDELVVHEWGVFTVFNDVKYANEDRKAEWGALPEFFYRQFPTERLRWSPAVWKKPIIYFYAQPQGLKVNITVNFPEGAPVVWWPAAAEPIDDGLDRDRTAKLGRNQTRPFRFLAWDAWLGAQVPSNQVVSRMDRLNKPDLSAWAKVQDFSLPANCWLSEARLPSATQLTVTGSNVQRSAPWLTDRSETERFLYYDGLVPAPKYLTCTKVEAKALTLRNAAAFDVAHLFVVDRRDERPGAPVGFYYAGKDTPCRAGTTLRCEPRPIAAKDWPAEGVRTLRLALLDAGLYAAEADVILKLWHKPFFESSGVTAFHILPAAEYDRMLPLTVNPAPAQRPVRVGIAHHPHVEVEPEVATRVATLIRQLDDGAFAVRQKASEQLREMGPWAIPMLRDALAKNPALEVRQRIEAVLQRVDAADWLRQEAPTVPPVPKK